MMPLKNNQSDTRDSQEIEKSKALNTEEILSLLSKTSNDFTRESEISENISNLFKKTSLKEMANSTSQKANLEAEDNIKKQEVSKINEIEKDYEYTRANLYSIIEKGQEAINGIMEVAGESASPRAYEVAGQLIKSVADTTDKLADLHKKLKEIDEDNPKQQNTVTNNALFVGSTSELSKMIKDGLLNNNNSE